MQNHIWHDFNCNWNSGLDSCEVPKHNPIAQSPLMRLTLQHKLAQVIATVNIIFISIFYHSKLTYGRGVWLIVSIFAGRWRLIGSQTPAGVGAIGGKHTEPSLLSYGNVFGKAFIPI